jgi:hypothetical protein
MRAGTGMKGRELSFAHSAQVVLSGYAARVASIAGKMSERFPDKPKGMSVLIEGSPTLFPFASAPTHPAAILMTS